MGGVTLGGPEERNECHRAPCINALTTEGAKFQPFHNLHTAALKRKKKHGKLRGNKKRELI